MSGPPMTGFQEKRLFIGDTVIWSFLLEKEELEEEV